jgi:hypothetical protein
MFALRHCERYRSLTALSRLQRVEEVEISGAIARRFFIRDIRNNDPVPGPSQI